LLWNIKDYTN